jgi:CHAD domain-containing protein
MVDATRAPQHALLVAGSAPLAVVQRETAALGVGSTRLSGAEVIGAVLEQFARNLILNDALGVPETGEVGATTAVMVPGYAPRRRREPEERIHQARISIRRLRSTLRTFSGLLDPRWSTPLAEELAWYGTVLGDTRDLSVLRAALLDEDLPMRAWPLHALLVDELNAGFSKALETQRDAQATERYRRLLDELRHLEIRAAFTPAAFESAKRVLPGHLDGSWSECKRSMRRASDDRSPRNLHVLRIRAKRVQQSCETVALVLGAPVKRTARAAERLQRRLGAVHDAYVADAWLRSLAARTPTWHLHLEELAHYERVAARERRRGWRGDASELRDSWNRWHRS